MGTHRLLSASCTRYTYESPSEYTQHSCIAVCGTLCFCPARARREPQTGRQYPRGSHEASDWVVWQSYEERILATGDKGRSERNRKGDTGSSWCTLSTFCPSRLLLRRHDLCQNKPVAMNIFMDGWRKGVGEQFSNHCDIALLAVGSLTFRLWFAFT